MRGWVWWAAAVGCLVFVACGKSTSDDGDDGSADGGMSGSSGSSRGGSSNPTGGRGGTTGGQGGTIAGQGGTIAGQGGSGAGGEGAQSGAGGDAGGGGAPRCMLAGGVTCSSQAACDVLGCGTAWSRYDENMCVRPSCADNGLCPAGERCVAAPVGGRFEDPCGNEADSCDTTASGCECIYYEECFPSAACLAVGEYPPENDCPIAALDCDALEQAAETLQGYLDGDAFLVPYEPPANIASSVQACLDAVDRRLTSDCEI